MLSQRQLLAAAHCRTFGLALANARMAARLTQGDLVARCHPFTPLLTRHRIGLLERGLARPRAIEIATLLRLFPLLAPVAPRVRPIVPGTPGPVPRAPILAPDPDGEVAS